MYLNTDSFNHNINQQENNISDDSNNESKATNILTNKYLFPASIERKIKRHSRRLAVPAVDDHSALPKPRRSSNVSEKHIPQSQPTFVVISKKGFAPYYGKKENQDSYFVDDNFDGKDNCHLFGVCDGHGKYGHYVSQLVAQELPGFLKAFDYLNKPEEAIKAAVNKIDETLQKSQINTKFSGTTLIFSLIVDDMCYTANLGDSRAVVVCQDSNTKQIHTKALSTDHKLEIIEEKERVLASGGRVEALPGLPGEDTGPQRVWLPHQNIIGLAMSRSLGDDLAHSVGVSSVPQITKHKISNENDLLLVYGSDGIWEFISNDEAAKIIMNESHNLKQALLTLVKQSADKWMEEEGIIDDITVVICTLSPTIQRLSQQHNEAIHSAEWDKVYQTKKDRDKNCLIL